MSSWEDYQKFISRVDSWYTKHEKKYLRYMALYGREILTETEFKRAFGDLNAPLSELEVHTLYQMLDPHGSGEVDYTKLYEAIWLTLADKFIADESLYTMGLEQQNKWLLLTFKVPSCEPFDMPTTFEQLVDLSYTGAMLRAIIQNRIPCIPSRSIVIFTDVSRYAETIIHCSQQLYDSPYVGGPKCAPEEAVIYYEFSMGRVDCPLLTNLRLTDEIKKTTESQTEDTARSTNQGQSSCF